MRKIILIGIGLLISYTLPAQITLTQEQCREMALKSNEEVQKADNSYRQAELEKAIAHTAYLPNLSGSAMAFYMPEDMEVMNNKLQMHGTYMASVSIAQPIYTGGKIKSANRMAQIGIECSEEVIRKTRMEVIYEADKAYWTYIVVNEKVKLLESFRRQLDTLYSQIKSNIEVEMATQNDLLRIEAKRSQIMYQLQKAKNGYDLCRISLCNVVGAAFDTQITVDTVINVSAPQIITNDISLRPELKLLEKQIAIQDQQIKATRADFLPTVGLAGMYYQYGNIKLKGYAEDGMGGYMPFKQSINDGAPIFMLYASIPIFHWGEGRKKVEHARIQLRNSKLDLQKNSDLMNIELHQATQNVTDGYNMVQTADMGLKQADENLRVMLNRYEVQMSTLTDLLDAQTLWQEAHSSYIESRTQYKIYESAYLLAAGIL